LNFTDPAIGRTPNPALNARAAALIRPYRASRTRNQPGPANSVSPSIALDDATPFIIQCLRVWHRSVVPFPHAPARRPRSRRARPVGTQLLRAMQR
jgi:hypothetical protein